MVSVVSGSGLGLANSSRSVIGLGGEWFQPVLGRAGERVTVNAATGNLVVQNRDGLLAGLGDDIALLRTYNSRGGWDGDNADGWRLAYYRRIGGLTGTLRAAGSTLKRTEADGFESTYVWRDTRYVSTDGAGAYDSIAVNTDGSLTWTDGDTGTTETYLLDPADASNWRLGTVTDTEGHQVRIGYDAAGLISTLAHWPAGATSAGETVTLVYDAQRRLTQVDTRADGGSTTRVRYAYDASGRLAGVTTDLSPEDGSIADGRAYGVTYTYDDQGRLRTLGQTDGSLLTIDYDSAGRVRLVTDALGRSTSVSYDDATRTTTVTDPLNQAARFVHDTQGRLVQVSGAVLGSAVLTQQYSYDPDGNLLSVTDPQQRTTTYTYDARGNLLRRTDPTGAVLERRYDSANRLTAEVAYTTPDPDGAGPAQPAGALTTQYLYDTTSGRRRLRFVISAEGRVTEHRYDSRGLPASTTSYAASRWTSTTATLALLTAWVTARSVAERAAVQHQTYAYDLRGQLASTTRYSGTSTSGSTVTYTGPATTTYTYDPFGRLLQTRDADGRLSTQAYDGLDRLLLSTDAAGATTLYSHDDAGRTTTVQLASPDGVQPGLRTVSTYDSAGQLLSQAQFSGTAPLGQTRYAYDAAGRLRMSTDPTGQRRWWVYDEAGREVARIDALGHVTETTYDAAGRMVLTTAYARAVDTTALVDAQGQPVDVRLGGLPLQPGSDDRRQWLAYDAAGRLVYSVAALGEVSETRYDGAGRVVAQVQYARRLASLPAAGGTLSASAVATSLAGDPADRLTRHFYDADGRQRATLDAEGYLVEQRYDQAGRLVERIAYTKATTAGLRATGTLTELLSGLASADNAVAGAASFDRRSLWWYDGQGRVILELDAEGQVTEHTYSAAGLRTQTLRYAQGLTPAAAAALTATSAPASARPTGSAQDRSTTWTHDGLGRIATETGPDGTITAWTYDAQGRLTRTERALGTLDVRSTRTRYDAQGRVTAELSANGAALLVPGQTQEQVDAIWAAHATTHAYDDAGRRIRSTDATGHSTVFYYDAAGRLSYSIRLTEQGGEVEALAYTAFGEVATTRRYTTRLATSGLALPGGLATPALDQMIAALADTTDARSTLAYNQRGQVQQAIDALGFKTETDHDAFGQVQQTRREVGSTPSGSAPADGRVLRTDLTYDRRGLLTTAVQDPTALAVTTRTEYDAFGRIVAQVDALNRRTTTAYLRAAGGALTPDGVGRQVVITDATNAQRRTTYDAFDRIVRQTDALGHSVTFQHDDRLRRLTVTTAEGVQTVTQANAHGQIVQVTDASGTTTHEYDANGNRIRSTDALGQVVEDQYDAVNRLRQRVVDPTGLQLKTTYEYDAAHRLLTRRTDPDGLNLTTTYQYDGQGRAVRVTDPAGVVTRHDFDAEGRLVAVVVDEDGLKLTTRTQYDAQGRVLTVTQVAGTTVANASAARTTAYHYDLLGRRTQEVVDPDGLNLATTYDYDAAGQLVRVSDALGVRKRYTYDAAGRETYCIDALGGVERREYDGEGQLVRRTFYANAIATDGLPVAARSADIQPLLVANEGADLVERRSYDQDGRLRFVVDAQGGVSETRYDTLGRVASTTTYARTLPVADRAASGTDAIGAAVARLADPAHDRTARFAYDEVGRLRLGVDAAGAVTETVYDRAGRVSRTVQYATPLPTGAAVQAPAADPQRDRVTRTVYDAAGRAVQQVDAEGYLTANVYDNAGNLTMTLRHVSRVQRAEALDASQAPGARVSVLSATATPPEQGAYLLEDASLTRITSFSYDRLNRRTISVDAEQHYEVSVYNDALGATVQRYNALGGVATMVYDTAGRLVQETSPVRVVVIGGILADVVNRYEYDLRGNRIKTIEAAGLAEERVTLNLFDANNRMVRRIGTAFYASDAAGNRAWVTPVDINRYNALGQLVEQTTHALLADPAQPDGPTQGGRTSRAYYDTAGRKVAELAPDHVLTRFTYDGQGNLLTRTTSGGTDGERTLRFSYDALGRKLQTQVDGAWTWEYGQPVTVNGVAAAAGGAGSTQPQTLTQETLQYDAFGQVVRSTDARGHASFTYYDRIGRRQLAIDAGGYAIAWDYGRPGSTATQETRYARAVPIPYGTASEGTRAEAVRAALAQLGPDPDTADRIVHFTLDRLDRVRVRTVQSVAFEFAPTAMQAGTTEAGVADAVTEYSYDGLGHITQMRERVSTRSNGLPDKWQVTDITYDALGREIRREAPEIFTRVSSPAASYRPTTETEYDALGRVTRSVRRGDDPLTETDDRITRYAYDSTGHTVWVADAENNIVLHAYDANGDLVRQTHQGVQRSDGTRRDLVKTFRHDAVGRLVETIDLDTGESRQMRYNAFGDMTAQGANGGWQEWFQHDALGRVWKTNSGDGTIKFFVHDANGNVTRELRAGLGPSTYLDYSGMTLAQVLADPSLVSTVRVYDARNQQVRTVQARMAMLDSEATLVEQFSDTWVPQGDDLNGTATAPGHTTLTTAAGSLTPLTGGAPGTAPGGTGSATQAPVSQPLPSGLVATFALNLPDVTVGAPGTTDGLIQATMGLQIPTTWPTGHFRVTQNFNGTPTVLTTLATAGSYVTVGGGAFNNGRINIEWQPAASADWLPITELSFIKFANPANATVTFNWSKLAHADDKIFVALTPESGWGGANSFTLLVDAGNPARSASRLTAQPLLGGRIGMFSLSGLGFGDNPIETHQIELLATRDGELVGGGTYRMYGTSVATLVEDGALHAGAHGTVWAGNRRSVTGILLGTTLQWTLGPAHAGDGTLRWRPAGASADTWISSSISSSSTGAASLAIGTSGTPIADGTYDFVIEQGDARVAGRFTLTGGVLTVADHRLQPLDLPPERIVINGPVDAQGRGQVALTIGSVTVTAATDANGQATFDLSDIRRSLGLDRWSVASLAFSYTGSIGQADGTRRTTHAAQGTLALYAARTDGRESFQFTADGITEHQTQAGTPPASQLRLTPPPGAATAALTLWLGPQQPVQLSPTAADNGTQVYDLSPYLPATGSATLAYTLTTTDAQGRDLTHGSGQLALSADGTVAVSTFDEQRALSVALRIDGRQVPQARLDIPGVGTVALTGTWVPPALVTHPDGSTSYAPGDTGYTRFDWDASSALPVPQPNGPLPLTYTLTGLDSAGNPLADEQGLPVVQNGRIVIDAQHASRPVQLQQQARQLNLDSDHAVSIHQAYNAFGELSEEFDERVAERARLLLRRELTADELAAARTTYRYNQLGKLVSRTEAQTGVTLENGYAHRIRPVTTYSYDLLGRQTTQTDANGVRTVRSLLDGTDDLVTRRVTLARTDRWTGGAVDGDLLAVRNIDYNPFGEAVTIWSETNQLSTRSYDRLGRVVAVTESVRREGSTKIDTYDAYTYDALGQQIRHVQYAGATARTGPGANDLVTRTDYDGMGRVVSTVSAAGFQTRYEYTTATVDGLRGQSTIGTAKVTYQADGRSLADRSDYFGHVTQHTDLSGNVTLYVYDAAARLSRQTSTVHAGQTQGQSIHYAYYASGALKSQVDAVVLTCTEWLYDDAGNRTGEAYYAWAGGRRVGLFQSNTVTYDEHNRMVRAAEGNYYSVSYEYDAVGNRRLADASYWDDVAGARKQQTYWYKYNNLNHITIAKGMLAGADGQPHARATGTAETGAEIIAGAYGTALAYNALGERVAAIYRATDPANPTVPGPLVTELYTTDGQGHVLRVLRDGREVLERTLDAAGRTLAEEDRSNASQVKVTGYIYDADNRLQKQVVGTTETTFFYENGTAAPSATGAGPLMRAVTTQGGQQSTTTYTYDYWDEARQKTVQKTDAGGSGTTVLTYNANGHLVRTLDQVAGLTTTFFNSANGLVLQREREQRNVAVGSHVFFYAAGRRVGEIRNDPQDEAHPSLVLDQQGQTPRDNNTLSSTFKPVVTADFDQNYEPFNLGTPGNAATYYTVRAGDTLAGVALQVWGNASLWYLIAEANGLSGTEALQPGQLLRLPNGITNIHNNSQTLRPYNPADVIGDVDPTVSRPPPPPDLRCGAFSTIVGVIVSAVVTFYTLNPALGAVAGDAARQYSSAALNGQLDYKHFVRESAKMMLGEMIFGPLGSLGQFLSDPKHPPGFNEHSYDYQSTLIAGAAGLASQGMGAVGMNFEWSRYTQAAAQAAASNATSQYLAVAMGRADEFSWRAVAASALGAAAGAKVSSYLEGTDWGAAYENLGANAGGNWVGGVVEQRLLPHEQRDYPGVFAGTVGGIIGDGILAGPRAQRRANSRSSPFSDDQTLVLRDGGPVPDPQATQDFTNTLDGLMAYQGLLPVSLDGATQYADAARVGRGTHIAFQLGRNQYLFENTADALAFAQKQVAAMAADRRGLRLSTQAAVAQQEFRRFEIQQMNAAAAQQSLFTIESAALASAAAQPLSPAMQHVEVGLQAAADVVTEVPAMVYDLGQAAVGATYTALTGDTLDLTMRSSLGSSAQGGARTGELLQNLNPAYGFLVGQFEVREALKRGDTRPLAAIGAGMLTGAAMGRMLPSVPGYRPGGLSPSSSADAATRLRQTGAGGPIAGADAYAAAERTYEQIRTNTGDVALIAQNTGIKPQNIQKVKDHVFYKEHLLDRYRDYGVEPQWARFDADPSMAESWLRLMDGSFTDVDMRLLRHETAEAWYMKKYGPSYLDAHTAADRRYPSPY